MEDQPKLKAVYLPVTGNPSVVTVSFKDTQDGCQGFVQHVPLPDGATLVCNEDAIAMSLQPNKKTGRFRGIVEMPPPGYVLGNAYIIRHNDDGEQIDVTDEDIAIYTKEN